MNSKARERMLLIIAAVAIALLLGDKVVLTPLLNLWDRRSTEIAELDENITRGQGLLDRERSIRKRWREMQRDALPEVLSVAEGKVIAAVDRWTSDSRISFTSYKPSWQDREDYQTLEVRATAFGDMRKVTEFLYELERDPLPLRIENLEIAARDKRGDELGLSIGFTGLWLPKE